MPRLARSKHTQLPSPSPPPPCTSILCKGLVTGVDITKILTPTPAPVVNINDKINQVINGGGLGGLGRHRRLGAADTAATAATAKDATATATAEQQEEEEQVLELVEEEEEEEEEVEGDENIEMEGQDEVHHQAV